MFERFTEKARRIIFFARYEASQFGSPYIETEHLLLGLVREDKALSSRFLRGRGLDTLRGEIEQHTTLREKTSTTFDLPLSNESKRVLEYAVEEADGLNHKHIGTEHLLLGLLREEKCFAAQLLTERGVRFETVRQGLADSPHEIPARDPVRIAPRSSSSESISSSSSNHLSPLVPLVHPLVGRQAELERILHILGCRNAKNPVLVGELGVGKRTIVGGLAKRIDDGAVPSFLAQATIVELNLPPWGAMGSVWFEKFSLALSMAAQQGAILFVDDLHTPVDGVFGASAAHLQGILKRAVVAGQLQCISVATPAGYARSIADHGWLEGCFQPIRVAPASESDSLQVLRGIKQVYEEFHSVTYTEEALASAAACASAFIPERHLPGKAVDVMDEAGSIVKLRMGKLPDDIIELQKRIYFIVHRLQAAIENHEFEKARFYSDEERKERENLRLLQEQYKKNEPELVSEVTRDEIERVVAAWTGATVEVIRAQRKSGGESSKDS